VFWKGMSRCEPVSSGNHGNDNNERRQDGSF